MTPKEILYGRIAAKFMAGDYDESNLATAVTKDFITAEQKDELIRQKAEAAQQ